MYMFLANIAAALVGVVMMLVALALQLVGVAAATVGGLVLLLAALTPGHGYRGWEYGLGMIAVSALIFMVRGSMFSVSARLR